jgi:thiomorpholine-carboxylate dehydrogenase
MADEEREDDGRQERDNDVLFIKESAVRKLLNWNDCVDAMESAMVAISSTQFDAMKPDEPFSTQTSRTFTPVLDNENNGGSKGVLLTMPGYASNYKLTSVTGNEKRHSTLSCKLVTSFSGNSQLRPPLPTILATILLFNTDTGKLKAIVDGTDITAWRTAAVSLVATKYLYQPHLTRESNVLAIVGCGAQVKNYFIKVINYNSN